MKIVGVRVNSAGAGTTGSAVIDILKNGVSIWTTAGNRPTLATAVAGDWTVKAADKLTDLKAGDVVSYDIISISTTPQTNTTVAILLKHI